MDDFEGRTAVVTGGGSGIGRGLALTWAAEGMNVVVADIRPEPAQAVAREIQELGAKAEAIQCDVSNPDSVALLADQAFSRFGTVDLLCNNAGVGSFTPLVGTPQKEWKWVLAVNLFGIIHGINSFVPRMRAQGTHAHIVNTGSGSTAVDRNYGNIGLYVASKAAVDAMTERLRRELEPDGIGVSLLIPSRVKSNMRESSIENRPAELGPVIEHRPSSSSTDAAELIEIDSMVAGRIVRDAVKANRLYIHTDRGMRPGVLDKMANHIEAFTCLE